MNLQSISNAIRNQNKLIKDNRDNTIDCMKGIAIILVVIAHSGPLPTQINHWIYMFHMALFFMISGYLWNPYNSISSDSIKGYIKRKIKSLYIPYLLFNGTMILMNNLLIDLNLYTNNPLFLSMGMENAPMCKGGRLSENLK